jgi:hypothetical protein
LTAAEDKVGKHEGDTKFLGIWHDPKPPQKGSEVPLEWYGKVKEVLVVAWDQDGKVLEVQVTDVEKARKRMLREP